MYSIVMGPLLWLSFLVFFGGLAYRVWQYVNGLSWQLDRVAYGYHTGTGALWAVKSIFYWLIPFRPSCWKKKPVFQTMFFLLHIGAVILPLFLAAHVMLIERGLGLSWPTLPPALADILTLLAIAAVLGVTIRRVALPEVRILNTWQDWYLLVVTMALLVTGYVSSHQDGSGNGWLVLHVLTAEVLLISAPFTKFSHIVLYFCSRAQIGMDFGIKRGGERGRGIVW